MIYTSNDLEGLGQGLDGRCTLGVVFPILKGRQLCIHCSDSEWSFATKQILVTRITTAQTAQTEIK